MPEDIPNPIPPPRSDAEQIFYGQTIEEVIDDLEHMPPTIDLRQVPRDTWENYLNHEVTVPPDVEKFINGQASFTREEIQSLEVAIEAWHQVTHPFAIAMESTTKGRPTPYLIRDRG